jgi:hypothetical protein
MRQLSRIETVVPAAKLSYLLAEYQQWSGDVDEVLEVLHHGTRRAISFLVGALAHQLEIPFNFRIFGHPSKTASHSKLNDVAELMSRFLSSPHSAIATLDVASCRPF